MWFPNWAPGHCFAKRPLFRRIYTNEVKSVQLWYLSLIAPASTHWRWNNSCGLSFPSSVHEDCYWCFAKRWVEHYNTQSMIGNESYHLTPDRFIHHHGWNFFLFDFSFSGEQHPTPWHLFSGHCCVAGSPESFFCSCWLLPRHISYCTFTGQKWIRWLTCIHIHTAVPSLSY